jgi:homoserine kinase type II
LNASSLLDPLLDQNPVDAALARHSVGRLLRYWPASHGIENTNYFIRTTDGEFVLTLMERKPFAGDAYFTILDTLQQAGLPVAAPIVDRHGAVSSSVLGRTTILQHRLPGSHVALPTEIQLLALGRLIARMHIESQGVSSMVPIHPRDLVWMSRTCDSLTTGMRYASARLMEDSVATVSTLLRREDVAMLPTGVIHGDIFRDNVLFQDDALCGIIDFHQAARGAWLLDLAVAANDWCCDVRGQLNREKAFALLKGYHTQRPLTRQEIWFFSPFRLYAALMFWLARQEVYQQAQQGLQVRSKNPRDMEAIVMMLRRGFEYFDERLFETSRV